MLQILTVCALLTMESNLGQGQEEPKPREVLVELTVSPMAAPKPALKYQLLPELKDMNPGNPCLGYLKCFMEQQNFFFNPVSVQNREKWEEMPLKDLPLDELRDYGHLALRRADEAARLDTPDWQVLLKAKSEGSRLLMPEIQEMRKLATALRVRCRGQMAEKRFDDAIASEKTMLALGRHMEAHPSIIADLVGLAIAGVGLVTVEEMIQQPGCPNLYWALTELPRPFIDLHKGFQAERLMWESEFALLDDSRPMSEEKLGKVRASLKELSRLEELKHALTWLDARIKEENHVRAARRRLIDRGLDEKKVNAFLAMQAILLDEKREYEMRRDEHVKWLSLPYWQAEPGFLASHAPDQGGQDTLFCNFLPAFLKVRGAQARTDRRIAMLRSVEALRLYAAEHDGKLPTKLSDLSVPVPDDPITGKPFAYKVDGTTAELHGAAPKAFATNRAFNLRYVVNMKK
jgi:hypothetical protein